MSLSLLVLCQRLSFKIIFLNGKNTIFMHVTWFGKILVRIRLWHSSCCHKLLNVVHFICESWKYNHGMWNFDKESQIQDENSMVNFSCPTTWVMLCLCNDGIKHNRTWKFQSIILGTYLMWPSNYGVGLQLIELALLSTKGLHRLPN